MERRYPLGSYLIKPSSIKGTLTLPPSKSHTLRAILFGLMADGKTVIHNPLPSPDTEAMIRAVETFGAKVERHSGSLTIHGVSAKLQPARDVIDAGNSGLVLRLIGALSGLSEGYSVITGDLSIRERRSIAPLLSGLNQLSAFAVSSRGNGYAPMIVKGPMIPGSAVIDGEDSQFVSGLLIVASFLQGTTFLTVKNPGEKPWVDLTLAWLTRLGIKWHHENHERYTIYGGASYPGFETTIPGDFSSAAFPLAAALTTGSECILQGLDMNDSQGDKIIIDLLRKMGAEISVEGKSLKINRNARLKGIKIDANDCIDALPILAVLGCFADNQTVISNAKVARSKESDRIHAIAVELRKMGAKIEERADGLCIERSDLTAASLQSHSDHRIAMALSVAALGARGESRINGVECIAKTYPSFAEDLLSLGAHIEVLT